MSTLKAIILGVIALGLLVAGLCTLSQKGAPSTPPSVGAAVNHMEQGVWWFANTQYNGSAQQMSTDSSGNVVTTGSIATGSSTPSALGNVVMDSSGTTTLMVASSGTAKGACLQFESDTGVQTKAYIHATSWVIAAGTCK